VCTPGTLFLWIMWPSFNAVTTTDSQRMRAIANTLLSLCACVMTTFGLSMVLKRRLDMVHIQNSTLAGGVAVGACADLYMEPAGAMLIGSVAAVVSVLGYVYLQPWLAQRIGLLDTCGVHNLHGMPGVLSAICSAIIVRVRSVWRGDASSCVRLSPVCLSVCAAALLCGSPCRRRREGTTARRLTKPLALGSGRQRSRRTSRSSRCW
jgi:ammonia channel protein AmtB